MLSEREDSLSDREVLGRFSASYEVLRNFCTAPMDMQDETRVRCVEAAALLASAYHPGRLLDGSIENVALRIGKFLEPDESRERGASPGGAGHRRRVLHVSPFIWHTGGHTRTLMNWIRMDTSSVHSLVLTQSCDPVLEAEISRDLRASGGDLILLPPTAALLSKAKRLRSIARQGFEVIVLHHTCNDVVPTIAFAAPDLPPVAIVNDCDQAFWLGTSIVDVVVNHREAATGVCVARRRMAANAILPIPLLEVRSGGTRSDARAQLGLAPDQLMLLTVARAVKYRPAQSHDFMKTAKKILDGDQRARLFVVGLSEADADKFGVDYHHPRIHLCGPQPDPAMYRAAADLYLESMPFGSATAALEAAQAGVPTVLAYSPTLDLFVTNHGLENILTNAANEQDYLVHVSHLLNDAEARERLGMALQEHMGRHHTENGWRAQLTRVYDVIEGRTHSPRDIESTDCEYSDLDLAVSSWQASIVGHRQAVASCEDAARNAVLATVRQARGRRDYAGARELLAQYTRAFGLDRRVMTEAVALLAHRLYKGWRPVGPPGLPGVASQ